MRSIPFFLSLLFLSGCFTSAPVKHDAAVILPSVSGSVVDAVKLKAGGKIGLARFKAGPQAEDDEQLDALSARLVLGSADSLGEHKTTLVVDRSQNVDFVLDGYIEEFSTPTKMARMMGKKRSTFSVSGEIWRKDSGAKVMTFASSFSTDSAKIDPADIAYRMGRAIGDYIASQTAKE